MKQLRSIGGSLTHQRPPVGLSRKRHVAVARGRYVPPPAQPPPERERQQEEQQPGTGETHAASRSRRSRISSVERESSSASGEPLWPKRASSRARSRSPNSSSGQSGRAAASCGQEPLGVEPGMSRRNPLGQRGAKANRGHVGHGAVFSVVGPAVQRRLGQLRQGQRGRARAFPAAATRDGPAPGRQARAARG